MRSHSRGKPRARPIPKSAAKASRPSARRARRPATGRQIWLDTARQALIEEGTAGIEINKLAKRLKVSRGGFYWFFKSRAQLLDELLAYWARSSVTLFEDLLESRPARASRAPKGVREFRALLRLWIDESNYDPRWDGAVRDWARTSPAVLKVVESVDRQRIAILERIFVDLGFRGTEAHVRARITYYHQVGYYALGIRESRRHRLALLPCYARVLTERALTP